MELIMSHYTAVINVVPRVMISSSVFTLKHSFFGSEGQTSSTVTLYSPITKILSPPVRSWGEVKCLNKCSHIKMLLCSCILHFMAFISCAVAMINAAALAKEVVGIEHLPLGGSLGAIKKYVTHLRRQDFFSPAYLSVLNQCALGVKLLLDVWRCMLTSFPFEGKQSSGW